MVGSTEKQQSPPPKSGRKRTIAQVRRPLNSSARLLDKEDVMAMTKLGSATIDRMVESGEFPRPFKVRPEAKRSDLRWTLGSIEQWANRLQNRAQENAA